MWRLAFLPVSLLVLGLGLGGCASSFPGPEFERFAMDKTPKFGAYPDVPAVVLLDRGTLFLETDPVQRKPIARLRRYKRIKIFRPSGMRYASLDLKGGPDISIGDVIARAFGPDGTEYAAEGTRLGPNVSVRFGTLPVGTVVEFVYDRIYRDPRYLEGWSFRNRIPTVRSAFAAVLPKDHALDVRLLNNGAREEDPPQHNRLPDGRSRLFWARTHQPAIFEVPAMAEASLIGPHLRLNWGGADDGQVAYRGFETWDDVAIALFGSTDPTPELTVEHQEFFLAKARDAEGLDRAQRVADLLLATVKPEVDALPLRYQRIRSPDEVLDSEQGNRLERVSLLLAALRAVGVEAHVGVAAYRTRGRLFIDFPDPAAVDAPVVIVQRHNAPPAVIDLMSKTVDLKLPSVRLQQTGVIAFLPDGASVYEVPVSSPSQSATIVDYDLNLLPNGTVEGAVHIEVTGAEAGALRAQLVNATPEEMPARINEHLGARGAPIAVESTTVLGLLSQSDYLEITARAAREALFELDGRDRLAKIERFTKQPNAFWRPSRKLDIELGHPRQLRINILLAAPSGYALEADPMPIECHWAAGRINVELRTSPIRILRSEVVHKAVAPAQAYRGLGACLDQARGLESQLIRMRRL